MNNKSSENNIISLSHVSAGYNGTMVLHDISMDITEGSCVSLLGSNGSGKTTLLRAIAGIIPSEGDISINNKNIRSMKRREIASYIGFLSQMSHVYFSYSVYDTVMQGRYLYKGSVFGEKNAINKEIVEETLESLDLTKVAHKQITALSGGQLQRVMLARCIAQRSPVLLLDEPMNHLDLRIQSEFVDYLMNWKNNEVKTNTGESYKPTIIGVYHDINIAAYMADEIAFLKDGHLLSLTKKEDALDSERLKDVYNFDVADFTRKISLFK